MPTQPAHNPLTPTPELLSPAGDWDCLRAAVANGADAVYLGTKEFNARVHARNFSLEELGRAIAYSHNHGVRVYLTLNILVKNREIEPFLGLVSRAYSLGVDGIIIQHVSFLPVIKENFPGLSVFVSTQAAIGNTSSASLLKSADRIILPRELRLEEVKKVISSGVRAEVFVHGALCFSYSGLCLFSSFVGDRSGNRGCCAQLCRQKYNGCYPLSTRELCLVKRIPELVNAGISGFKIEGRMRSALYVAVATRLYRKAIDSFLAGKFMVPEREMAEIEVVFNREFTEGFMFGDTSLISPEKPMNRGAFLGVIVGGGIVLERPLVVGDGIGIWGENSVKGYVIREMFLYGRKVSSATAGERVNLAVPAAEGSKIFLTSSSCISIKHDFAVKRAPIAPVGRRSAAWRALKGASLAGIPRRARSTTSVVKLLVKAYSAAEAEESLYAGAHAVFYNIFAADFPGAKEGQERSPVGAYLPRIINDEEMSRALGLLGKRKPAAILTGNLGFLLRRAEFDVPVYVDYSLNAFNDLDLLFFQRYNTTPVLSPELSLNEMAEFQDRDVAIFCHGDIVLITTLVPISAEKLPDEKGAVFPVRKEAAYCQVLNSRPFGLFNDIRKLYAAGFRQFFIDKQYRGAYFTKLYLSILKEDIADRRMRKGYTAGHLYRPVR